MRLETIDALKQAARELEDPSKIADAVEGANVLRAQLSDRGVDLSDHAHVEAFVAGFAWLYMALAADDYAPGAAFNRSIRALGQLFVEEDVQP